MIANIDTFKSILNRALDCRDGYQDVSFDDIHHLILHLQGVLFVYEQCGDWRFQNLCHDALNYLRDLLSSGGYKGSFSVDLINHLDWDGLD